MNVPKLRFKEFNDEWIEGNFSKTFSFISNNSLSRNDLNYNNQTNIFNIHYGDILTKMNNIVDVSNFAFPSINTQYLEKYNKKDNFLCNGDIVIADTAEDYTAGKSIELQCINNEKIISGLHTIPLRPIIEFSKNYLGYYLNSSYFHNQLIPLITGIKVMSITKSNLENTYIRYPSKNEQEKIGTFLSLLAKKIELQSKKIEALKLYKKGLLKAQYYKIKDINNVEISQFAKVYQPTTLSQSNLKGGEYSVFGANGIIGYHNEYNHELEQVTISCRGENSGKINLTPKKCWINGNSMVINIDNSSKITKDYLYYILNSQNLNYLISGSGQPQITRNVVLNHKIPLIEYNKQYHYAKVFNCFGKKIKLEENKLTKLEKIKKGLMQNMFV